MVKINDAKVFLGALVFTCGASAVCAQGADVATTAVNASESKTLADTLANASTPVATQDVKATPDVVKDEAKAPVGKATEAGVSPNVVVEISAPPAPVNDSTVMVSADPFGAVNDMPVAKAVPADEVKDVANKDSATTVGVTSSTDVVSSPAPATEKTVSEVKSADTPEKAPVDVAKAFAELNPVAGTSAVDDKSAMPSEQLLGPIESDIFKEMADIERETALLSLKVKRDRLLADIEKAKADLRKNQMDEMERREQMVRDRVKWEIEQEEQAKARAKAEAEAKAEEEKAKLKEEEPGSVFEDEEDITLVYTIREIKGINGELIAVLNSERGAFDANVGYPLKNGFKVAEITPSTVKIKRGDDVALLLFSETGAVTGSSAPRSGRQSSQRSSSRKTTSKSSSRK